MWKKIATISSLLSIAAALMALPGQVMAAQTTVHGARIWNAPDHTRIVLDIAAPIRYKVFPLDNPPRLVVDLTDARLKGKLPGVDSATCSCRVCAVGCVMATTCAWSWT